MKIWELHGLRLDGAIRSTPDGDADVAGLVFSEKAYLLAVRDFRPPELVALVEERGAIAVARELVAYYEGLRAAGGSSGRSLVFARGSGPEPTLRRDDEELSPARMRSVSVSIP
ncbi:MAG: hypothetical protein DYG91_02925 [Chloroflexi bacterium CFX7]|nr:hypothetical protein [Chloroflexi bacterium CFX7]RIL02133.1 MAG: hypothetical protein DCC78_08685 [bacterium]